MQRSFRPPKQPSGPTSVEPGSLLRRLHEEPQEAINHIAGDIGGRRATSLGEAQAAAYLDGRMRRAGLRVSVDAFRSATGVGWEGLLLALLATAGVALYYWLPLPSLALALWDLAIAVFALLRPGGPLLMRKRPSQNVIATRALTSAPRWRVIVLAPLDSPPSAGRLARALTVGPRALIGRALACGLIVLLAALAILAAPLEVRRALWYAQVAPAAYLVVLAALDLWLARAPATPGAVNHAGALAALLESANTLGALTQTELWAVGLGATSTGAGLADLLRRYPFDREQTLFVGLESIGGGRLSYVTREGLLRQRPADPQLLRLVAAADTADPLIDAEPRPYRSEPTLTRPLQRDRRALTIIGLETDGRPSRRGSPLDTPERVDAEQLDRAVRLVVGLVKQIDSTSYEL
ncbi:MAG: hypothetical protein IPO81_16025 [Kouleothrix sp.]|nr:hypothetical protein [Kouleothrix sp.]